MGIISLKKISHWCWSRNASWWQRRTRLERRLSLLSTVFVFVAVGMAIAVAALVYRAQDGSLATVRGNNSNNYNKLNQFPSV